MNANENRKFHVEGLRDFIWNSDPALYVKMTLTEGDTVLAERLLTGGC